MFGVGWWFTAQNACRVDVRTEDRSPLYVIKIQAGLGAHLQSQNLRGEIS